MALSPNLRRVADYFLSFSNETGDLISNLKLQKLVYYAQAWHLGAEETPLFSEEFEAWVHGPVIPELYQEYKSFGWKPILKEGMEQLSYEAIREQFPEESREVLDNVANHYMAKGAFELEMQSHREMPWQKARGQRAEDAVCQEVIHKEWMQEWASQYLSQAVAA
jgi:uncharacterized phage-associated protein